VTATSFGTPLSWYLLFDITFDLSYSHDVLCILYTVRRLRGHLCAPRYHLDREFAGEEEESPLKYATFRSIAHCYLAFKLCFSSYFFCFRTVVDLIAVELMASSAFRFCPAR